MSHNLSPIYYMTWPLAYWDNHSYYFRLGPWVLRHMLTAFAHNPVLWCHSSTR